MTKHSRAPHASLPRDTRVGPFQVLRLLGRGGCGEVYLARDQRLGRKVALKVVHPELLGSEEAVERFVFEARATARFNHPHIVTIYEVGEHQGMPYVALEYLEGRSLRELLREERPTLKETARIALAITEALITAHAEGILHRDLKPENIFLPKDGRLRVLDFGLAKHMGTAELRNSSLTNSQLAALPFNELVAGESSFGLTAPAGAEAPPNEGPAHAAPADAALRDTHALRGAAQDQLTDALDEDEGAAEPQGDTSDTAAASPRALNPRVQASSVFEANTSDTLVGFDSSAHPGARGTPYYMAPEQWRGIGTVPATDSWALGVILWELLTGVLPLPFKDREELRARVLDDAPMPLLPTELELPGELSALVERCLRKPAAGRPSAEEAATVLRAVLAPAAVDLEEEQGPFRGLLPFGERHAALYFGRKSEVASFLERLRTAPILAVLGPSGAGKSSFVQAGVIPRLREQGDWQVLRVRPGPRPFHAIATRLRSSNDSSLGSIGSGANLRSSGTAGGAAAEEQQTDKLARELAETPGRLGLLLRERAAEQDTRVLLLVDQLEELYTLVDDPNTGERFLQALALAADDADEPLRVIVTLREDFLGRVAAGPAAQHVLGRVLVLRSPDGEALGDILRLAPQTFGYRYEDPALVDEMVRAVGRDPACLPLLSFAGRMLWEHRDRATKLLTRHAYRSMGGVEGALASHADAVIDGLLAEQQGTARRLLLRMVTADDTRAVVEQAALQAELPPDAEAVLQRLVEARLVTSRRSKGETGQGSYELAHEALIRSWHRLRQWLDDSREERAFLGELAQAAALWDRRGRRDAEVWQGEALEEARAGAERLGLELPADVVAFLDAGVTAEELRARALRRRRRLFRLSMVGATLGLFALLIAWGLTLRSKEREARAYGERATERLAVSERERAALALRQGETFAARALLRASLERSDSVAARYSWLQLEHETLVWSLAYRHRLQDLALSPDGRQLGLAYNDGSVRVVDAVSGAVLYSLRRPSDGRGPIAMLPHQRIALALPKMIEVRSLDGQGKPLRLPLATRVTQLLVSSDGQTLFGTTGTVLYGWDLRHPERAPTRLVMSAVRALRSVGSSTLLFAGWPRPRLYRDGKPISMLFPRHGGVFGVAAIFSDGRRIAVADGTPARTVQIWSSEGRPLLAVPTPDLAQSLAVDPTGSLLAVGTRENSVDLWDVNTGQQLRTLRLGKGNKLHRWVIRLRFSHDGKSLLVGATNGVVARFDLSRLRQLAVGGHGAAISGLVYAPDGKHIFTASLDGWLRRWDMQGRPRQARLAHPGGIFSFTRLDAKRLATGGRDGAISIWDARTLRTLREIAGHHGAVTRLMLSRDGQTLYSTGWDRTLRRWKLNQPQVVSRVVQLPRPSTLGLGSNDEEILVGAIAGRYVYRHDAVTLERRDKLSTETVGGLVTLGARGDLLAVQHSMAMKMYRRKAGQPLTTAKLVGESFNNLGHCRDTFFSKSGHLLLSSGTSKLMSLTLVDSALRPLKLFPPQRERLADCALDPTEKTVATASSSGGLRLLDAATGLPRRGVVLLLSDPPRFYGRRGVYDLRRGRQRAATTTWEERLTSARVAAVDDAQRWLCLQTFDGSLEFWNLKTDRRSRSARLPLLAHTLAVTNGAQPTCHILAEGRVHRLALHGQLPALENVHTLAVRRADVFLLRDNRQLEHCPARGNCRVLTSTSSGAFLQALPAGGLAVASKGRLTLVPETQMRSPNSWKTAYSSEDSVARWVFLGPHGLMAVGHVNGLVELSWLARNERILSLQLHGPILGMLMDGQTLHVVSELGDHRKIDLAPLVLSRCALLERVWRAAPNVWDGTKAVHRPPPRQHACGVR